MFKKMTKRMILAVTMLSMALGLSPAVYANENQVTPHAENSHVNRAGINHPTLSRSQLKTDDVDVTMAVQTGEILGVLQYNIKGNATIKELKAGDIVTEPYPAGTIFEVTIAPSERGQIDYIKVDGHLYNLKAEGDLTKNHTITFDDKSDGSKGLARNHFVEAAFVDRSASLGGVPDDIQLEVGKAYRITPNPIYGNWSKDDNYYKVFDLRDYGGTSNDVEGGVWIKAIAPTPSDGTKKFIRFTSLSNFIYKDILLQTTVGRSGRYNIVTIAGAGGQFDLPGNQSVVEGESMTFTVMSDLGYKIKNVYVDGHALTLTEEEKKKDYKYTFNGVTDHHDMVATFERVDEITLPMENFEAREGTTEVNWRVSPSDGYWMWDEEYIDWIGRTEGADWVFDVEFKKAGTTQMIYNVDGMQKTINIKINHSINATAETGGTISPKGSVGVGKGQNQTFTVEPAKGYITSKVLVDNEPVQLNNGQYTFMGVASDHTIKAEFEKIKGLEDKEVFVGETVSMTPVPEGGQWTIADNNILSIKEKNGTATFTGLKDGSTKVSYAVKDGMCEVNILVLKPNTSQADNYWIDELSITGWSFDEKPNEPTAKSRYGNKILYTYSDSESGDFTKEVPTDAGNWYVKATVGETSNYKKLESVKPFTISKAINSFVTPLSIEGWVFDEQIKTPNATAKYGDITYTYSDSATENFTKEVPTDAGNWYVKATVGETSNYKKLESVKPFTILKATNSFVTPLSIEDWVFDEQIKTPNATAKYGDITYTYSDSESGDFTKEVPTDAGIWYVKATVMETNNYKKLESVEQFTISKVTNSWIDEPSIKEWTYGEKANIPTAKAKYGENIIFTYSDSRNGPFTHDVPTNAGTWYLKATVAGTDNYTELDTIKPFVIEKRNIEDNHQITISEIKSDKDIENLVIKDGNQELVKGMDYDVHVKRNDYNVTVDIVFKGNYYGTVTRSYTLNKDGSVKTEDHHDISVFVIMSLLSFGGIVMFMRKKNTDN